MSSCVVITVGVRFGIVPVITGGCLLCFVVCGESVGSGFVGRSVYSTLVLFGYGKMVLVMLCCVW